MCQESHYIFTSPIIEPNRGQFWLFACGTMCFHMGGRVVRFMIYAMWTQVLQAQAFKEIGYLT